MTLVPPAVVDEILDAAETPAQATAMLEALWRHLEGIERWQPTRTSEARRWPDDDRDDS